MDCNQPDSFVHGISQARMLEWVAISFSRGSSQPRDQTCISCISRWILLLLFYFILLYNTVLVLPYIDMNPPRVYMSSQSWTALPPPTPYHLSGSSQCTSPKHPVSCIEPRLAIHFLYDSIHVSMPFSQIIPPSPSHRVQQTVLHICVSLAVSHTGLSLPSF